MVILSNFGSISRNLRDVFPGILNYLLMALVFIEMDTGKRSARSVTSF